MTRMCVRLACAAGLLALLSGSAAAQQIWTGIMDITKDTSGSGCGDQPGNKNVLTYRPFLNGGDPPSSIVVNFADAIVHLLNRDATSQFHGSGQLLATAIRQPQVEVLQKVRGSYSIILAPNVITTDTSTIRIPSGKVTLKVPDLGNCVFIFRGILTPGDG